MCRCYRGNSDFPYIMQGSDRMMISKKNIRDTAYSEFWGTEFEESVYLWEGAKHRIPLNEWDKIDSSTLKDWFSTKEEIMEYLEMSYSGEYPACLMHPDGIEFIHYKDFYKTKFS